MPRWFGTWQLEVYNGKTAHTTLTPYWSSTLHKKELEAIQLSSRRGYLHCKDAGARIEIGGKAKTYLSGKIWVS